MHRLLIVVVVYVGAAVCCKQGADCGDNECCVTSPDGNVCRPLASVGQACHLVNGIFALGKPESAVTECPCAMELTCIADDDGPRVEGAKGTCQMLLLS